MNEKREVILPSDFSGEKGKIVCYRISSYLELLYIDIRSRRIPEVQIQAYEGEAVMTVNFSFLGKCEVLLKNGAVLMWIPGNIQSTMGLLQEKRMNFTIQEHSIMEWS